MHCIHNFKSGNKSKQKGMKDKTLVWVEKEVDQLRDNMFME